MRTERSPAGAQGPLTVASSGEFRHVYHLSPARLLLLPLVWGLIVGPLLALAASDGGTPAETLAFVGAALLFTLIMLPFCALAWHARLVLTPEGIAHHQFGYTVRSRWDNLLALSLAAGAQCLVLEQPGTRSRLLRGSARLMSSVVPTIADGVFGDADLLAEGRLILLAPFMGHWRRGPLRDDLLRWAPRLFEADGAPRAWVVRQGKPKDGAAKDEEDSSS